MPAKERALSANYDEAPCEASACLQAKSWWYYQTEPGGVRRWLSGGHTAGNIAKRAKALREELAAGRDAIWLQHARPLCTPSHAARAWGI